MTSASVDLPYPVWSGEFELCGVTLHVHVLSTGDRIIEAADMERFMAVLAEPDAPKATVEDYAAFVRWMKALPEGQQ